MSAAFQVRKPFPSKNRNNYNNFSRNSGTYRQPEDITTNNHKHKNKFNKVHHTHSQQYQNKLYNNNKNNDNANNTNKNNKNKRKHVDPLFAGSDSDNNQNNDNNYSHQSHSRPTNKHFKSHKNDDNSTYDNNLHNNKDNSNSNLEDSDNNDHTNYRRNRNVDNNHSDSGENTDDIVDTSPAAQLHKVQPQNTNNYPDNDDKHATNKDNESDENIDENNNNDDNNNSADSDSDSNSEPQEIDNNKNVSGEKKKKGRNAPLELSSKVPVSRHQTVIKAKQYKPLDPRFLPETGEFKEGQFRQAYKFLDEYKQTELVELKTQLKKLNKNDPNHAQLINEVKQKINMETQRLQLNEKKSRDREIISKWKKQEYKLESTGKKPYYLKKSDIKQMQLTNNYLQLKAKGKVDEKLEQRRKHNAAKDHRYMPRQHA